MRHRVADIRVAETCRNGRPADYAVGRHSAAWLPLLHYEVSFARRQQNVDGEIVHDDYARALTRMGCGKENVMAVLLVALPLGSGSSESNGEAPERRVCRQSHVGKCFLSFRKPINIDVKRTTPLTSVTVRPPNHQPPSLMTFLSNLIPNYQYTDTHMPSPPTNHTRPQLISDLSSTRRHL